MRKQVLSLFGMVSVVLFVSVSANAATIIEYGRDIDSGAVDWRTASTAKPLDGDNIYGTEGWATWIPETGVGGVPASGVRVADLPSYVSSFSEFTGNANSWNGYAEVDNPLTDPIEKIISGTLIQGKVTSIDFAWFTVETDCSFVFGVMNDNLNTTNYNSHGFTLTSSLGNSCAIATVDEIDWNQNADMYFFKVENAVAGETFTITATGTRKKTLTMSGVTWDAIPFEVPEPSTAVLLLCGLTLVAFRFQKR